MRKTVSLSVLEKLEEEEKKSAEVLSSQKTAGTSFLIESQKNPDVPLYKMPTNAKN